MIPVKNNQVVKDGLAGEEISFGVGDPRWVMKSLADLYSDITTAVIREYSTNARDANIMAGNGHLPIRVTLPSDFQPSFIVEDDGPGMDIETFKNVYTQFGVSNKRETNDANGMLGFGSKSGAAYTTTFQVRSVKDGMRIDGVITRKPDWAITLKILSHQKTTEANGTRITIPVHNVEEFLSKAYFYKYWPEGSVLVNGVEPEKVHLGDKVLEGTYLYHHSGVVMGNVFYPIHNPSALFNVAVPGAEPHNFIHYADNGSVEFVPSREALNFTNQTNEYLYEVIREFIGTMAEVANQKIQACETGWEAIGVRNHWNQILGQAVDDNWRGNPFPTTTRIPSPGANWYTPKKHSWARAYSEVYHNISYTQASDKNNIVIVADFSNQYASRYAKEVYDYIVAKRTAAGSVFNKPDKVVLLPGPVSDYEAIWVDTSHWLSWPELRKEMKPATPKVSNTSTRVAGSWDYCDENGKDVLGGIIPDNVDVYYSPINEYYDEYDAWRELKDYRGKNATKHIVIRMPANRRDKFVRENPKAINVEDALKKHLGDNLDSLVDNWNPIHYRLDYNVRRLIENLDRTKILDPKIRELITLENNGNPNPRLKDRVVTLRKFGFFDLVQKAPNIEIKWASAYKPQNDYLLWDDLPYNSSDDVTLYLNAKYHNEIRWKRAAEGDERNNND